MFGVISSRSRDGSNPNRTGSISTITGIAPANVTAFNVSGHVMAGTMTSSPLPTPVASRARCRAAVPLEAATAWWTPHSLAHAFSNFLTQFPGLKYRSAITCPRCSITFGEISGSLERYRGDVSFAPIFIMPPRCLAHGGGTFHKPTRQEVSDKWNGLSCPVR